MCAFAGFLKADSYSKNVEILKQWIIFFANLKEMLQFCDDTAQELLHKVSQQTFDVEKSELVTKEKLIEKANLELKQPIQEIVISALSSFGNNEKILEMDKLSATNAQLSIYLKTALEEERKNKQLYRVLGICVGTGMALLLM